MASTESTTTIRNLKTCTAAAITGSSLLSTNEDVRGFLKCDQAILINNVEYSTHLSKPPSSWTVRCIELASDYQGETNLNVEVMFEVVKVIKLKPKKIAEAPTTTEAASSSSASKNSSKKDVSQENSRIKSDRVSKHGISTTDETTSSKSVRGKHKNAESGSNNLNVKDRPSETNGEIVVETKIDTSKPPPKPPKKLDPIDRTVKATTEKSKDKPIDVEPSKSVLVAVGKEDVGSKSELPENANNPNQSTVDDEMNVSQSDKDEAKRLEEARRLARERVVQKMKADRLRIEAMEKEKQQRLEQRQEASARKAKQLQDKTLERVALLKENQEREKLTQQEAAFEEETRRMLSQEYAQSDEYKLRMKRLRQKAQRRLREAEHREEIRLAQEDMELRKNLRLKKQQVDVSTTYVPLTLKQRRLMEQQSGVLSAQDISATETAAYFGSVPKSDKGGLHQQQQYQQNNRLGTLPDTINEYDEYDEDERRPAKQVSRPANNYQHHDYYYTDEAYVHNHPPPHNNAQHEHAREHHPSHLDRHNHQHHHHHGHAQPSGHYASYEEELQREEEAYIHGDANYFLQQEEEEDNAAEQQFDDDGDGNDERLLHNHRPHRSDSEHVSSSQYLHTDTSTGTLNRPHSVGEATNPLVYADSVPDSRAVTSQPSQQQNQQQSRYSPRSQEPMRYQEPRIAFAQQPQLPTMQKSSKSVSSRVSLQSTSSSQNSATKPSHHNNNKAKGDTREKQKEEDALQSSRRRQQLESAVKTWLQGDDDTTLAAKADLLSPISKSVPAKALPVPSTSTVVKKSVDDDDSSWSSDEDLPRQTGNKGVSFAPNEEDDDSDSDDEGNFEIPGQQRALPLQSSDTRIPVVVQQRPPQQQQQHQQQQQTNIHTAVRSNQPNRPPPPRDIPSHNQEPMTRTRTKFDSRMKDEDEEALSDVSDLTDQEDKQRRRPNHKLPTSSTTGSHLPAAAVRQGQSHVQPTAPAVGPPSRKHISGAVKPQHQAVPAAVLSTLSPTNGSIPRQHQQEVASGPLSGGKRRKTKPFQSLPAIPIAPYNPVPANY